MSIKSYPQTCLWCDARVYDGICTSCARDYTSDGRHEKRRKKLKSKKIKRIK